MSLALTRGWSAAIRAIAGVLTANLIYFSLSASGLVTLHAHSAGVFAVIKWAGAAYLIWLGIRMIVRAQPTGAVEPDAEVSVSHQNAYWQGFVVQSTNPNLLVYFTAVLPQFVDPSRPLPGQIALLAASSSLIELTVLSTCATMVCRAGQYAAPRFRLLTERLGGVLLMAAGAGLASLGSP
jgi:threonine/homoserine/homoserine lactone efflux protein